MILRELQGFSAMKINFSEIFHLTPPPPFENFLDPRLLPDQEVNPMQKKGPMMTCLTRTRQPMDPIHFGKYSRQNTLWIKNLLAMFDLLF